MTALLQELVAEARGLANDHPCVREHLWEPDGARACPRGSLDCSQTVYRCWRCGQYDYGEPAGPGYLDCKARICGETE